MEPVNERKNEVAELVVEFLIENPDKVFSREDIEQQTGLRDTPQGNEVVWFLDLIYQLVRGHILSASNYPGQGFHRKGYAGEILQREWNKKRGLSPTSGAVYRVGQGKWVYDTNARRSGVTGGVIGPSFHHEPIKLPKSARRGDHPPTEPRAVKSRAKDSKPTKAQIELEPLPAEPGVEPADTTPPVDHDPVVAPGMHIDLASMWLPNRGPTPNTQPGDDLLFMQDDKLFIVKVEEVR